MDHHGGKIAAGLLSLVIVWIIVFWLWTPTEGKISFAAADSPRSSQPVEESTRRPTLPAVVADPSAVKPAERPASARPPTRGVSGGVVAPEFDDYTVQPGETFASIAYKFFGSRGKADLIANANPLVDPTRIRAGRVIRIPRDPSNIQGKPTTQSPPPPNDNTSPGAARTHTVVRGDTLTGISQRYYGTIRRVDFILAANRNVLNKPEDLRPGQVLQIPAAPQ
ncbi:MAG: LysM peptidoglycan-binding domain-containing protein [Phycisphaeraceae bacterium]|nr:LysM peptidoglycan-binding domain-containing protein [Phycisphaeraceae bacterium]